MELDFHPKPCRVEADSYPKQVGERQCGIFCWSRCVGALLSSTGQLAAALNDEIITEATAQRYGLTRMWVTQAQVNRGQGRLQAVVFFDGVLYAQSNRATLEAIDAETGQKLWSKLVGQPSHPSLPPAHAATWWPRSTAPRSTC